jgi:hypothetical protein
MTINQYELVWHHKNTFSSYSGFENPITIKGYHSDSTILSTKLKAKDEYQAIRWLYASYEVMPIFIEIHGIFVDTGK